MFWVWLIVAYLIGVACGSEHAKNEIREKLEDAECECWETLDD